MLRSSFDDIGRNSLPSSSHESHTSELYPISSASSDRIRLRSPKVILEFIDLLELSIRIIFQSLSGICIPKKFAQVSFHEVLLSGYLRLVVSVDILFPWQNSKLYVFAQGKQDIDDGSTDYESRSYFVCMRIVLIEGLFVDEMAVQ